MEERNIYGIWLATRPGLTSVKAKELLEKYKSAKTIYFLNGVELDFEPMEEDIKQTLKNKNLDNAKYIAELCVKNEIEILQYEDDFYPPLLKKITNPPSLLYRKGKNIDYRNYPMASIVGSRILSDYGRRVTEQIAYDMSRQGFVVVSGMALGADGVAHISALKGGMASVAVLGCGADIIYPYENIEIYRQLCKYGAVLTEYPPGVQPTKYNFPARNRIVCGMSHLTVVTEARLNSGSLITARLANGQGKAVFAVPQNITSAYGHGTNQILKEYARVMTSASDAREYYVKTYKSGSFASELDAAVKERTKRAEEKKEAKTNAKEKSIPLKEKYEAFPNNLNEAELKLLNVLKNGPAHINKISSETGFPLGKVKTIAGLLEIRGIVYPLEGNAYGLVSKTVWDSGEARL